MAKTDVLVELFYDSQWNDITSDVLVRDGISITRGKQSEAQQASPSQMMLSIKNAAGKYSPRNPMSTLYKKIGRNTPIRVSVGSDVRFVGEVESWPQSWDVSGRDVWTSITANGIFRRLGGVGTDAPTKSPMLRYFTSADGSTNLIDYWPMELGDEQNTTSFPALTDSVDAVATAPLNNVLNVFGSSGGVSPGPPGGASAVQLSSAAVRCYQNTVATTASDPTTILVSAKIADSLPLNGSSNPEVTILVAMSRVPSGGTANPAWRVVYLYTGSVWQLKVDKYNSSAALTTYDTLDMQLDTGWHLFRFDRSSANAGADTAFTLYLDGVDVLSGTASGVAYTGDQNSPYFIGVGLHWPGVAQTSHVAYYSGSSIPAVADSYAAFTGYAGETVEDRLTRLSNEEGITLTFTGDATATMGPQKAISVLESLNEAADLDGGILYEDRSQIGVEYIAHSSLYNQSAAVTLDYSTSEVIPPLQPTEDTSAIQNDITGRSDSGYEVQLTQNTGTLNVQEPTDDPDGVGRYSAQITLNVDNLDDLVHRTSWLLHMGTWDEPRYPNITVNPTRLANDGKTALVADVVTADVGSRVVVENVPIWSGTPTVDQLVQGYSESIGSHLWLITFNTTPAGPYEVGLLAQDHIDSETATLNGAHNSSTTSFSVATSGARWIDSATYGSMFPFPIIVGGEVMTVTAISGTSSPQTFTVTRSVNGITKSHSSGAEVHVYQPLRYS